MGFEYSDEFVEVSLELRNTGIRAGAEIVQVYVKDLACSTDRPDKELKGFHKVYLESDETRSISIELNRNAFAFFSEQKNEWVIEPGEFGIMVGSSSRDIRLRQMIEIN